MHFGVNSNDSTVLRARANELILFSEQNLILAPICWLMAGVRISKGTTGGVLYLARIGTLRPSTWFLWIVQYVRTLL